MSNKGPEVNGNETSSGGIPMVRRVRITSGSQLPRDYSQTPGGTIFSTTPGGTRIVYDREFLLSRRDSPLARTPPVHVARIPGVTCPAEADEEAESNPAVVNGDCDAAGDGAKPRKDGDGGAGGATEFHIDV
uniref:Eukaryotic translation initiation factor 4E-binding protein 2 n=2 Tax=Macrostomum lignano TaxID=282301 RepID=A0A1I8FYT8_9PLAT